MRGWDALLDYHDGVFTLCVRDKKKIIARAVSHLEAPFSLIDVAKTVRQALETSGRIKG